MGYVRMLGVGFYKDVPMPSKNELLHAQFEALLAESDLVAYGQTFNDMDEFFLIKGRKLLQETFEAKLQEHIQRVEAAEEAEKILRTPSMIP